MDRPDIDEYGDIYGYIDALEKYIDYLEQLNHRGR
jgi:hypothetical protein